MLNLDGECERNQKGKASFIEQVNGGGLTTPSDLQHVTCQLAHSLFKGIMERQEVKKFFLRTVNPRGVFVVAFMRLLDNIPETQDIKGTFCWRGHFYKPILEKAAFRFFNLV